jgi:hypothetical protein
MERRRLHPTGVIPPARRCRLARGHDRRKQECRSAENSVLSDYGYRAEGAPGTIHDHSASTAFLQGAASCAGCARGSLLAINNTVAPASGGWKTRYERSDRKVSPSDLWYWLRLLRPGAVAARRDVVGALHARQAPHDRHAAPGDGIGRDNRLRQGDPPLIAARVRAGHLIVRFGSLHSSSRRVGDLDLAPIS